MRAFSLCHQQETLLSFQTRRAVGSIKPGVERSGTPGLTTDKESERAKRAIEPNLRSIMMNLSPRFAGSGEAFTILIRVPKSSDSGLFRSSRTLYYSG